MIKQRKSTRIPAVEWDMSANGSAASGLEYTPATDQPVEVWANNANGEPVHYATHQLDGTYTIHDEVVAKAELEKVLSIAAMHDDSAVKRLAKYWADGA